MIYGFLLGMGLGLCVALIAIDLGRARYRGLELPRVRR